MVGRLGLGEKEGMQQRAQVKSLARRGGGHLVILGNRTGRGEAGPHLKHAWPLAGKKLVRVPCCV